MQRTIFCCRGSSQSHPPSLIPHIENLIPQASSLGKLQYSIFFLRCDQCLSRLCYFLSHVALDLNVLIPSHNISIIYNGPWHFHSCHKATSVMGQPSQLFWWFYMPPLQRLHQKHQLQLWKGLHKVSASSSPTFLHVFRATEASDASGASPVLQWRFDMGTSGKNIIQSWIWCIGYFGGWESSQTAEPGKQNETKWNSNSVMLEKYFGSLSWQNCFEIIAMRGGTQAGKNWKRRYEEGASSY